MSVAALAAGSLLLASCGSVPDAPDELVGGDGLVEPGGSDLDQLVAGLTAFGTDLHVQVAEPNENVVLSPASIAIAFGMARAGAAGTTADEIDSVLGFPADGATTHASFNALTRALADAAPAALPAQPDSDGARSPEEASPPALAIANGVFPDVDAQIKQEYLTTLGEQYGAGVVPVDFGGPDAKKVIDAWVREQTRDRIEKLFDDIDPTTRLVLANAVYLKADWVHAFAQLPTQDLPFTLADGSRPEVPTMSLLAPVRHAAGDVWAAVELPYVGDRLVMRVIVPTGEATPADVLEPAVLAALDVGLTEGVVDVRLPKWDFDTDVELIPELEALGMQAPLDPAAADFSGISDAGLHIADAIHRATITVDEWGTEAAAVTGLAFAESGPPLPAAVVHADRPFAFVILDEPTGVPLFMGQVADPAG